MMLMLRSGYRQKSCQAKKNVILALDCDTWCGCQIDLVAVFLNRAQMCFPSLKMSRFCLLLSHVDQ